MDKANKTYSSDEYGVLFNKDKTELMRCPRAFSGSYAIPEGVMTIGYEAFIYCKGLTGITIANSVATIEYEAFSNCDGLTSVEIPGNVLSLGNSAFYNCDNLVSVTMGNGLVSIGDNAFYNCDALTDVNLPDSLISISCSCFNDCDSLTTITIPKKVSYIDYGAFSYTKQLKEVKFEGNAPVIESDAFYHGNDRTITAYYPEGDATWTEEVFTGSYGSNFVWKSYVPEVDEEEEVPLHIVAQGSCGVNVSWMIMSDGRLIIFGSGSMQFMMRSGSAPWSAYADQITSIQVTSGVESIADNAFSDCTNATTVTVADTVTAIGVEAFAGCENLETITFTGDVPEIGENAFENVEAVIEYPLNNDTWTEAVQESFGEAMTLVPSSCEHEFNQEVAGSGTVATCVTNGFVIMVCECGATEALILPVDMENHTGNTTLVGAVEAVGGIPGYTGDTVCECGTVMEYGEIIPAEYLLGDVTGDGKVTAADYSRLLAHVKKVNLITDEATLKAADVTGDGKVTAADYSRLLAHVKKINLLW